MKYVLMMSGTKADFDWFTTWSKQDLEAYFAFMHTFNTDLSDDAMRLTRLSTSWTHLLELAGGREWAVQNYRAAAAKTANHPERNYVFMQASRIAGERQLP